jgi:mRNA interferase RelE/StbE
LAYTVAILSAALKQLRALTPRDRDRLRDRIDRLAEDPRPPRSKRLAGTDELHRLRVGDYRVLYTIADEKLLVLVVRVGHRRDVYRGID